ncbi:MAG: ATP-grasp domain-containing protein [Candidatus Aadella gelida]|nr:ATP-grasp domain-containing protein [Candidatus Aadella gelida]
MKRAIFVTAIGGDIGQSVLRCLRGKYPESDLYGSDMDPFAASRDEVKKFYLSPSPQNSKYANFVKTVVLENNIDYFLPIAESEIIWFEKNKRLFDNDGVKILINSSQIVDTFSDKFIAAQFFKENNIKHPRTFLAEKYNSELDYPYILKKRLGYGGKGLIKVDKRGSYDLSDEKFKDCVVQEYVSDEWPEYTVAVFSDGKNTVSISFKRQLGYGSLTKIAELINDIELETIATDIARLVGLKGSINLQFRKTNEGYVLLEINPRLSSTVYIRHNFGFTDVKWWIDILEGKEFSYVPKYESGVGVRRVAEVFFEMKPFQGRT